MLPDDRANILVKEPGTFRGNIREAVPECVFGRGAIERRAGYIDQLEGADSAQQGVGYREEAQKLFNGRESFINEDEAYKRLSGPGVLSASEIGNDASDGGNLPSSPVKSSGAIPRSSAKNRSRSSSDSR